MNYQTENYDLSFQSTIPHYSIFPELMPFVGGDWDVVNKRILLIGESHYLKGGGTLFSNESDTWYTLDPSLLESDHRTNINTRLTVRDADNYKVSTNGYHCKAHSIFYNMKSAIATALAKDISGKTVFENFSYYNYFQRPAEVVGGSIKVTGRDREVAFETLKQIHSILKPHQIIFVSSKAHDNFIKQLNSDKFIDRELVSRIPHPACAWWNTEMKRFQGRTGKEQFSSIIKDSGISLS